MRKLFLSFLLAILVPMMAGAQEREMYVVFSYNKTCTFYYDSYKDSREGSVYSLTPRTDGKPQWSQTYLPGQMTRLVISPSFADARPTTTCQWFGGFAKIEQIEGLEYLNTSEVTNMGGMFSGCRALPCLNVTGLDTHKVTNMSGMFMNCDALTSLDLSHFDTRNVTDMGGMFLNSYALKSLDLSNFETGNVTSMAQMFYGCTALESLDMSSFDTQKVTDMNYMFYSCQALQVIDVSRFDTGNVTNMEHMFQWCKAVTTLDVSHFDTRNVKNMSCMFNTCSALKFLDLTSFDTGSVNNLYGMFDDCVSLTTIYCNDDWYVEGRNSNDMFRFCTSLVGGAGTPYDASWTNAKLAHPDTKANPGYFTLKDGSEVTSGGDLTEDGKLDADDVVTLVNLILNKDPKADMNHDGNLDIADLIWLLNLILDKE